MRASYQLAFLPWAGLDEQISVGPVTFIPIAEWLSSRAPSVAHAKFWRKYARCYIGGDGQPTDSIVVVQHPSGSPQLTDRDRRSVQRAVDALMAAHLFNGLNSRALRESRRPGSIPIAMPDRINHFVKNYLPTDTHASITAGGVMSCWPIKSLKIQQPQHITTDLCIDPDADFLSGLGRLVESSDRNRFGNQVWRSLEWVRNAFSGESQPLDVQIIAMMTAFEHLLSSDKATHSGGGEIKQAFKENGERLFDHDGIKTAKWDFGRKHGIRPIPMWHHWFRTFFDLRSSLVHGSTIHISRYRYKDHPHILLAGLFFGYLLKGCNRHMMCP